MKPLKKHIISKSTFIRGQQCLKSLYLNKNHRELKDEISDQQRAIFTRGNNVGELAQKLFPGGIDLTPDNFYNFLPAIQKTQDSINNGVEVIYEAAFQYDGVLAIMDILVKKKNKWYAYEVKSAASVKGVYVKDASLQYHVITSSGINLEDISIIHLNSKYTKKGKLDLNQLFTISSVKKAVLENQEEIRTHLQEQKLVLAGNRVPKVEIGAHCNTPYPCDFKGHCWKEVPEYSVLNLNRGSNKVWDLFDEGIINIKDIPVENELSPSQKLQLKAEQTGEDIIDKVEIDKFLNTLTYPLYFLDFETVMPAIPLFDDTKVYQQLPFQYSLHVLENQKGKLQHLEYLSREKKVDPRITLTQNLIEDLKTKGTILVYNKSFEDRCLKELARDFPEYEKDLSNIRTRLIDLAKPFEKKHYYTAKMKGKHSIKNVLPALAPDFSYNTLEIQDGATANFIYLDFLKGSFKGDKDVLRNNLLEYCKLDTLAMVKILEKLYKL